MVENQLWKKGPPWLSELSQWPEDITLGPTPESTAEAKMKRELFRKNRARNGVLDHLLDECPLNTVLQIGACIQSWKADSKDQSTLTKLNDRNCGGSNRPRKQLRTACIIKQIDSS